MNCGPGCSTPMTEPKLCPECGSDDYNRMLRSDRPFIRKRYWWVMECYTCKYEEPVKP